MRAETSKSVHWYYIPRTAHTLAHAQHTDQHNQISRFYFPWKFIRNYVTKRTLAHAPFFWRIYNSFRLWRQILSLDLIIATDNYRSMSAHFHRLRIFFSLWPDNMNESSKAARSNRFIHYVGKWTRGYRFHTSKSDAVLCAMILLLMNGTNICIVSYANAMHSKGF